MRVEWLFFRWLAVIAVIALAVAYFRSSQQDGHGTHYDTIPLIQGGRASGMPLVGIVVDPARRDVSAVLGGPEKGEEAGRFFIVWKGKEGETYSTAFLEAQDENVLYQVSPAGEVKTLHRFLPLVAEASARDGARSEPSPEAVEALRTLLGSLPEEENPERR